MKIVEDAVFAAHLKRAPREHQFVRHLDRTIGVLAEDRERGRRSSFLGVLIKQNSKEFAFPQTNEELLSGSNPLPMVNDTARAPQLGEEVGKYGDPVVPTRLRSWDIPFRK
jgi:hypothetical protein